MRDKPCKGCPWRIENHGKPDPSSEALERYIQGEEIISGWYTQENRDRLWEGLSGGEMMSCHATDPNQWKSLEGEPEPCLGALILIINELNLYEAALDELGMDAQVGEVHALYCERSQNPMTTEGLLEQAMKLRLPPMLGGIAGMYPEEVKATTVGVKEELTSCS